MENEVATKTRAQVIGEKIRNVREMLNMTQDEFGDYVGVTGNSVARWERGGRIPSKTLLMLIEQKVKDTGIFSLTG